MAASWSQQRQIRALLDKVLSRPTCESTCVNPDDDAPIELIALDSPYDGVIAACRRGEPSFLWVNGVSDAIMAALSRGVDLVVPAEMFAKIREDFPPELPPYIKISETAKARSARSQLRIARRRVRRLRDSFGR
jgi:hypothetical protein